MVRKGIALWTVLFFMVITGGLALAKGGKVSGKRHPNLAAAQKLMQKAIAKMTAAQEANEFDMAGHAAKAKDLLDQAFGEAKQAATAANAKNAEKKEGASAGSGQ